MNQRESYLRERQYCIDMREKEPFQSSEKVRYWEGIIGVEKVSALAEQDENIRLHLQGVDYTVTECGRQNLYVRSAQVSDGKVEWPQRKDPVFAPFYCDFLQNGLSELRNRRKKASIRISAQVESDFIRYCLMRLQTVSIRVLILEMNRLKEAGMLAGEDEKEEYQDFLKRYLCDRNYIGKIYEQYPVLPRVLSEQTGQCVEFFCEIINRLEADKTEIEREILNGMNVQELSSIRCMGGDVHQNGRSVSFVLLNGTYEVVYKPRSLENERIYQDILRAVSEKLGVEQYFMKLISREDYGWEEKLQFGECTGCKEVEDYYERAGVQIFLAYCFGTGDLHCENMIARGAFPVLIDMEVLFRIPKAGEDREKGDALSGSVLSSGILPSYTMDADGMGSDVGALNGQGRRRSRIQVPEIHNAYTSGMKVAYRSGVTGQTQNRVMLNGKTVQAKDYTAHIAAGFQKAYRCVQEHVEIQAIILRRAGQSRCRRLISDTMKYASFLNSSYYPDLLEDGGDRELYLRAIGTVGREKEQEVTLCETEAMLRGDIPYFYNEGKDLMYDGRICVRDYFQCTPRQAVYERIMRLSRADERFQIQLIELSLAIGEKLEEEIPIQAHSDFDASHEEIVPDRQGILNLTRNPEAARKVGEQYHLPETELLGICEKIAELIAENSYEDEEGKRQLLSIDLSEQSRTKIRKSDIYFYEGQAGVLVFLYTLKRYKEKRGMKRSGQHEKVCWERLTDHLLAQLKEYIHSGVPQEKTGMFEGEFSIVFTCLLLYEIDQEQGGRFLQLAEMYAERLLPNLRTDSYYDLINGNAGAIVVLLKLYDRTGNKTYLEAAEYAGDCLCRDARRQKRGVGWPTSGELPLCGMAHGNSGILVALSRLYQKTGRQEFLEKCMEALDYEDSLYQEENKDWKDLRKRVLRTNHADGREIAWCHGTGGILLSRLLALEAISGQSDDKAETLKQRMEQDIERALPKLETCYFRSGMCICHGTIGNCQIIKHLKKYVGTDMAAQAEAALQGRLWEWREEGADIDLLPQEYYNPGFMTGLAGVGYYLLRELDETLPDIIA